MAAVAIASIPVYFPELRDKAEISYGDECLSRAMELLEGFGLPGGLLPLEDVVEGGYVKETGFVWIIVKKKLEHYFKKAGKLCSYAEQITCYLEKNRMTNIKGVKVKEAFFWISIGDISMDEKNPNMIYFKSVARVGRLLPAEHFARGE